MTGKRKASDDAPASARPPPQRRLRREAGYDSTVSSGDSSSDRTYHDDDDLSSAGAGNFGSSGDDIEGSDFAGASDMLGALNIQPSNQDHAEAEVQPPPPADQPAAAEVADQSVPEAPPAPEMVVPAADPVLCLGCGRQPPSLRLEPVAHNCLCRCCRSNPSVRPHCESCDGPRR